MPVYNPGGSTPYKMLIKKTMLETRPKIKYDQIKEDSISADEMPFWRKKNL